MAKRKTATRAGRAAGRGKPGRAKRGAATAKSGRSSAKSAAKGRRSAPKASGRRTGAGRSTAPRSGPAKGSAARAKTGGRRRKIAAEVVVTADVQRRWDAEEEEVPTPPSTLDYDPPRSAARTGRAVLERRRREYTQTSPAITGDDVDADWEEAYAVGDEAATGDNPTPDQDTVEALGKAVGVDYEDTEELKSTPKIDRRDKKRWELDPASSEDYKERNKRRS